MALWDGRFSSGPAADMLAFSESLGVDLQMFEEDIDGSIAHATMLGRVGLLPEWERVVQGLEAVRAELRDGRFKPGIELEDIHMAVETRLTEIIGEAGGRLHTARSRNDQVATDVRLWMKRRIGRLDAALAQLLSALLERVEKDGRTLIPGFTHLQRGQPVWLGHHLLAHAWMVQRDRERLADCLRRVDRSPLGAGAMAGTPHPIDRDLSASLLGFNGVVENAMDAVSARDHLQELAAACAIAMTHMSRQGEELVMWSSREFRLVRLSDAYSTGSSIMPQKRNPDAAELVRGKAGRVVGALDALMVMVKGLPLAYNRDLQEDRAQLFDAVNTTTACAAILAGCWSGLTVNRERYTEELRGDFLLATELADFLVSRGVPFREAHHVSGRLVKWCEERGTDFRALDLEVLREHHPAFDAEALAWLDPESAVERRRSRGGTAWSEVERQVALLRGRL